MPSSKFKKKKYKAIVFDVDGTLISNKIGATPSKKVVEAVAKASKLLHVGIATSRPIYLLHHIFDRLKLSAPAIISGGTQIIDPLSKRILWEKSLDFEDIKNIYALTKNLNILLLVHDQGKNVKCSKKYVPKNPLHLWIYGLSEDLADKVIKTISNISTVACHKIPSWKKNKVDVFISHASATKQHAVLEFAKILNINTHKIIGVGDGYNDFPLLMACGLRVAMGNAVDELKAIADYVAPSVKEDGVADVIEKFVLNHY